MSPVRRRDDTPTLVVPHYSLDLFSLRAGQLKEVTIQFVQDEPIYVPRWAAEEYYDYCTLFSHPPTKTAGSENSKADAEVDATPLDGLMF